jgi:hypothetical protein
MEGSRVIDRGTCVGRDLSLCVHRRGAELAVSHTSALKDIQSVLALLHGDTQEVEGTQVHGELPLEGCSGVLQKLRARCGEDDVINTE